MTIGERIKQRRNELSISAEELGKRVGKNRATIYRYENGGIEKLSIDMIKPFAKALDTTPEYLMGWEEEKPTENGGLSDAQKQLIEFAKSVPEEKAAMVLRVMKSMLEDS